MPVPMESDCTTATPQNPIAGCDLHNQIMTPPPTLDSGKVQTVADAGKPQAAADAGQPQKIIIQVEMAQHQAPPEPDHIKVHHNPASVVARAIGHFGKQYALGVKDSVEPRNLGRMTLPVGIGVGTQVIVAHQLAMGIKGGFNQIGSGLNQLGKGEAQLGAGQLQLAQQLGAMQQEIIALQATKTAGVVGGPIRALPIMKESAGVAPHISASVSAESMVSLPAGAAPRAEVAAAPGIAPEGSAINLAAPPPEGTTIATAIAPTAIGGAVDGKTLVASAAPGAPAPGSDAPQTIAQANGVPGATNIGIDSHGFAVPMTPKQVAKARSYDDAVTLSETQLDNANKTFDRQLADIAYTMQNSPNAQAFIKDMEMRRQYAMNYDQQDDHKTSRLYISDARQDTDNLKRLAKAEHNDYAVMQLDALKQTVNQMDDVEKHFHKRPTVVLAATTPDQTTGA